MPSDTAAQHVSPWNMATSRLNGLKVALISFLVSGVPTILISLAEGSFIWFLPKNEYISHYYIGTFFLWPFMFIFLIPLMNFFVFKFYESINVALATALENRMLVSDISFPKIAKYTRLANSVPKILLCFVVACLIVFLFWEVLGIRQRGLDLHTWIAGPYGGMSALFFAAVMIWIFQAFIVVNAIMVFVLWCLFLRYLAKPESELRLRPSLAHYDGAAGFTRFGRAALFAYFVFFSILLFSMVQIGEKYYYHSVCTEKFNDRAKIEKITCDKPSARTLKRVYKKASNITLSTIYNRWKVPFITSAILMLVLPMIFIAPVVPLVLILRRTRRNLLQNHHRVTSTWAVEIVDKIHDSTEIDSLTSHYRRLLDINHGGLAVRQIPSLPFDLRTYVAFLTTYLAPALFSSFQIVRAIMS